MDDVDDMITLSELSENAIMNNLKNRFEKKKIYTYTGTILVALNPFTQVDIYSAKQMKKFTGQRTSDNEPHIFAIAENAFSNVRNFKQNQAIIISGESGAGKTESTKYILQYLTSITSQQSQETWVEQQILEANTVLEAFGNSKTLRNNNSSRFGKFMQINFDSKANHIIGASIVSYLLEKSRVVKQGKTERNYHIFYQFLRGTSEEEKSEFNLKSWDPDDFNYLSESGCNVLPGGPIEDKKQFEKLKLALTVLNITASDIKGIWTVLSAILTIGNIIFEEDNSEKIIIKNLDVVKNIAFMLAVDEKFLIQALSTRRLVIRGETTFKPFNRDKALENRDAISKAIYDNLFQKIVAAINSSLAAKETVKNFVGVLDIFGFEGI
ncbi:cytochrome c oxidase subunit 1 [Nowakowskiella sp. JEL0078]|nr:cytochrome c oxidase subunit 1 [Nowakowskiella sp. JEL0078]